MEYQKFIPEGWENTKEDINLKILNEAMNSQKIMQAMVSKCDEDYNLHIDFGNNIYGIIPREDIDIAKNIRDSILKNKENTLVQFKVKKVENNSNVLLSRKVVKEEALNWAKEELQEGNIVHGIVKNIRPFGAFVDIGGGVVRTFTYRRYISFKNKNSRRKILYWTKD